MLSGVVQSEEQAEQLKTNLVSTVPIGLMGSLDEVAKTVSFLASDDSNYVTGIDLFVDGGMAQI
jgi:NAD(P)-dependent dehydrogenase (short-subunit alcohol dehydrogenase family)